MVIANNFINHVHWSQNYVRLTINILTSAFHTFHSNTHQPSQGSYGRLGLNNSDNQPTLKQITDFPPGIKIKRMATSRGSDGHSIAVDPEGNCYSWGDGQLIHIHCYLLHFQYLRTIVYAT